MVGVDPATGALAVGAAAQAERALQNLAAILEAAGTRLDRVVKATIFLADMGDFAAVKEAYTAVFSAPYPARSTIAVRGLPLGALSRSNASLSSATISSRTKRRASIGQERREIPGAHVVAGDPKDDPRLGAPLGSD